MTVLAPLYALQGLWLPGATNKAGTITGFHRSIAGSGPPGGDRKVRHRGLSLHFFGRRGARSTGGAMVRATQGNFKLVNVMIWNLYVQHTATYIRQEQHITTYAPCIGGAGDIELRLTEWSPINSVR